jgi:hypothetical protein
MEAKAQSKWRLFRKLLRKQWQWVHWLYAYETERSNLFYTPWLEVSGISHKLRYLRLGLWLCLLWSILHLLVAALAMYHWLLLLGWGIGLLPAILLAGLFLRHRFRGDHLYRRFQHEVAQRHSSGQSIQIPESHRQVLTRYLKLSDAGILKVGLIVLGLGIGFCMAPMQVVALFQRQPEPLSQAMWAHLCWQKKQQQTMERYTEQSYALALQLERGLSERQKTERILQQSAWEHYRAIVQMQQYSKQIRSGQIPEFRADNPLWEALIGMLAWELERRGATPKDAPALIRQAQHFGHTSQKIQQHYYELIRHSQDHSYRDYLRINSVRADAERQRKTLALIKTLHQEEQDALQTWKTRLRHNRKAHLRQLDKEASQPLPSQ